jgi:membrane protein
MTNANPGATILRQSTPAMSSMASPARLARLWRLPGRGWLVALGRAWNAISSDSVGLFAAGCAFWGTLALFPAISTLVSLYGLVFDPSTVAPQLEQIRPLLPPPAYALIAQWVQSLVSRGSGTLGTSLLVSTALTFWTAATGTKSMLSALNLAYEAKESRSFLRFQATGLLLTLSAILAAMLGLAILVVMPQIVDFVGLSNHEQGLVAIAGHVVLIGFVLMAIALLYHYGPNRPNARWHWITPGSLLATLLWLVASWLFSEYVGHLATYDATYGPLGAVAGVMMWFWVSSYLVLAGAELDAELAAADDAASPT